MAIYRSGHNIDVVRRAPTHTPTPRPARAQLLWRWRLKPAADLLSMPPPNLFKMKQREPVTDGLWGSF